MLSLILALGGLLYLCPALRQDQLLLGLQTLKSKAACGLRSWPGEGGRPLWEEEQATSCKRKQNVRARPRLAGGGAFQVESSEKYVGICLKSWNFLFNIPFKHILWKTIQGGGSSGALCAGSPPQSSLAREVKIENLWGWKCTANKDHI